MLVPARYRPFYVEVAVDVPPVVMTAVGPRSAVGYRWKCNRCGAVIQRNTAGAQSHLAKHVREKTRSPVDAQEGQP